MNNSKLTNESQLRASTKADYTHMQHATMHTKGQVKHQNYSALGPHVKNNSMFSSLGSD